VVAPVPRLEGGLRLIVAYKLSRAVVSLGGALLLAALYARHHLDAVHDLVSRLQEHSTSAFAVEVSRLLLSAVEPRHLVIGITALVLDAVVLCFEGWALLKGRRWGAWVVVAATGVPVPFEVASLVRHFALGRVLVLAVNVAIVTYLLARAWRMHHPATVL
jgi:uncharacterized membrane protein (DUF2068 family)